MGKRFTTPAVLLLAATVAAIAVAAGASASGGSGATAVGSAFELLGRYETGLGEDSAETVAIEGERMYVTSSGDVSLDVVDISDPSVPTLVKRVDLSDHGDAATSVDARDGLVAVAVKRDGGAPGTLVLLDADGEALETVEVGVGPDHVTFGHGKNRILVANEGEPTSYGEPDSVDPVGSVTVVDYLPWAKKRTLIVQTAGFERFDRDADDLRAAGVRIFGPGASVSQDLEPEYIALDPFHLRAYVTLQENNAVAVLKLAGKPRFEQIVPLGEKDHSQPGQGLDASDKDDRVNIETWPVMGLYQPDGIAAYRSGPKTYLVTANEGDARDYDGLEEEERAGDVADLDAIPAAADDAALGRLTVTTAPPASGGSGQTALYSFGARSVSIWDARSGERVWDSGDLLERLVAHVLPQSFGSDNDENTFDTRSDAKGPEPEGVTVGRVGDRTYAFIGLERVGGVVVMDVTNPRAPVLVQYLLSRDFTADPTGPDSGPEVMELVPADASPSGDELLAVGNEVSGTVALWGAIDADTEGTLTLLDNNDGESSLLPLTNTVDIGGTPTKVPVGGGAAFKAVFDRELTAARAAGSSVVGVYAGDAFLASATLACSIDRPDADVYDSVLQRQIGYDAHVIGNHEFDFTPDFLERFIRSFETGGVVDQPFLSANLSVAREPGLQDLATATGLFVAGSSTNGKVIARSAIVTDWVTTQRIGIVGATTWLLPTISSPRDVAVTSSDAASTAAVVQDEVDRLTGLGVSKIVFVSHLQDVDNDKEVVALLRDVDIAVAGGGDELLANDPAQLLPGESDDIVGPFPLLQADADGKQVPIVTTAGNYKYLGRLVTTFDAAGNLVSIDPSSGPVRVVPESQPATDLGIADAVAPDPGVVATVDEPVAACLDELAATPVARSDVLFDVSRPGVRGGQANGGNLVADAWLDAYDRYAATSGLPARGAANAVIAVQNGGGIRQNAGNELPTGGVGETISRLDVIDVLPFSNTMVVVEGMTAVDVKAMFELSADKVGGGGFLQIGGVTVTYDLSEASGSKVREIVLADGTPVVTAGAVDPAAPATIRVVTNDFTAGGGDGYALLAAKAKTPLRNAGGLTIPYELPLREWLGSFPAGGDGLPLVPADDPRYAPYPDGEERSIFVP